MGARVGFQYISRTDYFSFLKAQSPRSLWICNAGMRVLVCLLLAAGAVAAPFSVQKETEGCPQKTRFKTGRQFVYNYEGETVSGVIGASTARSALKIKARVSIETVDHCQHVMKVDSVELWESQSKTPLRYKLSEGYSAFAVELQAQELTFTSRKGTISHIVPHPLESVRALNIKRGILSALQAELVNDNVVVDEVDVAGSCRVNYTINSRHYNGQVKRITKTRNLTECSERSRTNIGLHVHPYPAQRTLNLLKSTGNCQFIVTANSVLKKVRCVEKHLFRPFSAGHEKDSGAMTTTIQSLSLIAIRESERRTKAIRGPKLSLRFEHPEAQTSSRQLEELERNFVSLARESAKETKPESANRFARLVYRLRRLDSKAADYISRRIVDCDRHGFCRPEEKESFQAYLFDALPHCGSEGCAKVMSTAIKEKWVSGERGNMFLAGLGLVSVPNQEMIGHVLELCRNHPSRMAMLTLGTVIHKFCEKEPSQCKKMEGTHLDKALWWLQQQVGERCDAKTPEQFDHILMALKAIGNAGRPFSAMNKLIGCSVNNLVPVNVSVAALEALRRFPCSKERTNRLLTVYRESSLEVETRIAAYLALMKCPSPEVFHSIAEILSHEVSKQVGSFVWTHLTNAMESTEPLHGKPLADMIKKALLGKKLREFNLSRMRFSRAYEVSAYSDLVDAGGSAQGHLIFHPNSYFPRSAMFNLTVDVLGVSTNILETAARFEGFEMLVEQVFGPEGLYPNKKIMDMFNLRPHEEREAEERDLINNIPLRGRRSIQDDINKVERNLKKLHQKMDIRKHNPSGSLSVKVFGNEMRLASFDDIKWIQTEADNVNMVDYLIKLARGGKKTYSKSFMFLDVDTTVPTILGLPLKLEAKGTTVARLELNGKFDIRNMFWGPMNFDIRGYARPSAVVEIDGKMVVDAMFAQAGIMLNSSLYSSTEIKGNATYKQGETLRFELGVPQKPIQIINMTSSLYTTLNDEKQKIEGAARRISPSPCLNATRVLGVAICGHMSLPIGLRDFESPFFPLSGPATLSLVLTPTDKKLTKYQFLATRIPTEDDNEFRFVSRLSTPGATWEREFEANSTLWLKKQEKYLSVSMGALGYRFGKIEGSYNNASHAVNLTFSSRDVIYGHPVILNVQYFNLTEGLKRELGFKWSASYKNYTLSQLHKIYNNSGTYGVFTNTTYWPMKHLIAEAEFSIPKRYVRFNANHTCSKTSIKFQGNLGKEHNTFLFNFTNKPTKVGILINGKHLKSKDEAVMKMSVQPWNHRFTVHGSYVKAGQEKGVYFKASHDNKKRVFSWYTGIMNGTTEKTLKSNATVLGRRIQAAWTYFNLTNEKGLKFSASALNKNMEAVWSYLKVGEHRSLKFNATGFNKTAHAALSFLNITNEKALRFNATAMNKNIEAMLSYAKLQNERVVKFNMTALNKTVETKWSFINYTNEKALKFNATALDKSVIAMLSYNHHKHRHHHHHHRHHHIKFNATALGKKVEMMWAYDNMHHEKSLKFNATALNKSVETILSYNKNDKVRMVNFNATVLNKTATVSWSFANLTTEKVIKLNTTAANKTLLATMSFVNFLDLKAIKFNGTACNKSIVAKWSFFNRTHEKAIKFEGNAFNKSIASTLSFLNYTFEKAIKFNGTVFNKSIEATWAYDRRHAHSLNHRHHHFKFNATVLSKKAHTLLAYDETEKERSIRFNVTGLNKTFEVMSKMSLLDKDRKLSLLASFQNYSVAAEGEFFNSSNSKISCLSAKYLNRVYGKSCIRLINSTMEKSLSFNISALNRSMEMKTQLYKTKTECANRLTVQYNGVNMWESWTSFFRTNELKIFRMNATVAKKSVGAAWFFENRTDEKAIGFNVTGFGRDAGIKGSWYNTTSFKEVRLDMSWSKAKVSTFSTTLFTSKNKKALIHKAHVLNWLVEQKGEYMVLENGRRRDFVLIHVIRNGSKLLFMNDHSVTYRNTGKTKDLYYSLNLKAFGRRFAYGWEATYRNDSNREVSHHEMKLALMYSFNRKVSLTTIFHNNSYQMSSKAIVEYLPSKTMEHSLVWEKQRKIVTLTWEALPKIPIVYRVHWTTKDGFAITSELMAFRKRMVNSFKYFKGTGHFQGRLEISPKYPVEFNGMYKRENGLDFLLQIHAFKRTWNHKIEINKKLRRLYISVELIPKAPMTFEATYDLSEGLKVTTELSAFKKSIQWEGLYQLITKSLTSELIFLNQRVLLLERLDMATKSLVLQLNVMNRTLGFVGRFDWKNYAASAHVQYQKNLVGWSLILNKEARNLVFNVTLSPRLSGQIAAEMPTDNRLQVTVQRKFGVDVVNESRLIYELESMMSRVMFSYNTTTSDKLVALVNTTKMRLVNMTIKYFNMTQLRAGNLTKELQVIYKKLEARIKPQALKIYKQIESLDYKLLMRNASVFAKNITLKALNMSRSAWNLTAKNFPILVRNATTLYKRIHAELKVKIPLIVKNATNQLKNLTLQVKYQMQSVTKQLGNATAQLKNVSLQVLNHFKILSSDLKVWAKNVSKMVGGITIRNQKVGAVVNALIQNITIHYNKLAIKIEKLATKMEHLRQELRENVTLHLRNVTVQLRKTYKKVYQNVTVQLTNVYKNVTLELKKAYLKLREMEIRKQKVGPMLDKAVFHVRNFTCNFNASCTLKNLTKHAQILKLNIRAFTVFDKTFGQHVVFIRQRALNLTKNLPIVTPQALRNYTVKVIHLTRNFTKDIKNVTFLVSLKVKEILHPWSKKVLKITAPLAKHMMTVSMSVYNKTLPHLKKGSAPAIKLVRDLKTKVVAFIAPMMKPLTPMTYKLIYQVRNITVRQVPIGHAMDRLVVRSIEILKSLNHTVTTNLTIVLKFINETSMKSPEEIVDITVFKTAQLFNYTKVLLNKTMEYSRNLSKSAINSLNMTLITLNKTLASMPADKLVKNYVKMLQSFARNVSAEVMEITRQVRSLEMLKTMNKTWNEMDIANRVKALNLEARWQKVVATLKAMKTFDIKGRLLLVKTHVGKISDRVMNNTRDIVNVSIRAFNLTRRLVRMDITRENLVKELMAIRNETKRVALKHFHMAKNLSANLDWTEWKRTMSMVQLYTNMTMNKTLEVFGTIRKHGLAFYKEHERGTLKVYGLYKDLATDLYKDLNGKLIKRVNATVKKINETVHKCIREIRKYENMTYEQIALKTMNLSVKVYNLTRDFGVALYKNYSIKVIRLYNQTRNLTLTAYNQSLVMVNRTRSMALKYYNHSKVMAIKYYNHSRVMVLTYYNNSRIMAIKYYNRSRMMVINYYNRSRVMAIKFYNQTRLRALKYFNMSRNYTTQLYFRARNLTLTAYNVTRNYTMKGMQYLNKMVIPKVMEGYGKCKVVVEKAINKSMELTKVGVQKVKVWYAENKEKTIEELYLEAYMLANSSVFKAADQLKLKSKEMKLKLKEFRLKMMELKANLTQTFNQRLEIWNSTITKNLEIWNTTVMDITKELVSVYNQTAEVTVIAGRQLVVVFRPCFKILKGKTVAYLVEMKNLTLPLVEKARNFTLLQLEKAKSYSVEVYKNVTSCQKFKTFVAKYEIKQKVNRSLEYVKKVYQKVVKFVEESRPKIEAKMREAIFYVNVTLPKLMEKKRAEYKLKFLELKQKYHGKFLEMKRQCVERCEKLKLKYREIVANPKMFAEKIYNKIYASTILKMKMAINDSVIEQIMEHEIWSEFAEEVKRHELTGLGKEMANYSTARMDIAYKRILKVVEKTKLKAKELLEKTNKTIHDKIEELKQKFGDMKQKLENVKQMKLREIVEHEHVFKTMAFARNVTAQARNLTMMAKNYTLAARNMTLKWVADGKQYYKNLTILVKGHYKNLTVLVKGHYKNVTMLVKGHYENLTILAKGHYKNLTIIVRNYTLIAKVFYKNFTLTARNYTLQAKNLTLLYWNETVKCLQGKVNASKLFINRTMEKGLELYREKVVPYYESEILPVYEKLFPMYRNYSEMVMELRRNLPRRVMNYTLHSRPYLLLRDGYALFRLGAKLTIRESIIEARRALIIAYNHSINVTLRALNLTRHTLNDTMHKYNITKVYLSAVLNKTLNVTVEQARPYLPYIAVAKAEIIDTALFLNKYYGIEAGMRKKVMDKFEMYGPRLVNKAAYGSLEFINNTIRSANRTIGQLNETFVKLYYQYSQRYNQMVQKYKRMVKRYNETLLELKHNYTLKYNQMKLKYTLKFKQMVKEYNQTYIQMVQKCNLKYQQLVKQAKDIWALSKTKISNASVELERFRRALPRYVQVKKGSLVLTIPHPIKVEGNIRTLTLKAVHKVKNLPHQVVNMTRRAVNMTKVWGLKMVNNTKTMCTRAVNKTKMIYIRALNHTKLMYSQALNKSKVLYAQAFHKGKVLYIRAFNKTMVLYDRALNRSKLIYVKVYPKVYNVAMKVYNSSKKCPFLKQTANVTKHYFGITSKLVKDFNLSKMVNYTRNMTKLYLPVTINMTRMYAQAGYNISRNFTLKVTKIAWNATLDIMNSSNLKMAYLKALNYSMRVHNETLKLYRQLRNQTLIKYHQLNRQSLVMIDRVRKHELTMKYQKLGYDYYGHSVRMLQGRVHHIVHINRQLKHRIHHAINKVSRLLNPLRWIPPFESTAMIFGRPHVYTFDGTYYKFPGYELPECTYVLARDVLNDKFTLLSQEDAIILVTDDANVKIHGDGRVESITKVNRDGIKADKYDNELPLETAKTTVVRDSTYVTLKHELGIEIRCNVKRNLCTFSIAKWYHGRLMGLLGTNNNEDHDEMIKPNNKPAENLYDFVNSWEITKNKRCRVSKRTAKKGLCHNKRTLRCRQIFKESTSPFARFFKTINPKPFREACKYDYRVCDDNSPKDLKHCNASAAYVEALRMRGEYVNYLPECAGCGHKVGHSWFTGGNKMVDVVLLVSEEPATRQFSEHLPNFVKKLSKDLSKYSLRFGLVGFGGKWLHEKPHMVTMQGKVFGTAEDVESGFAHLKFVKSDGNSTSDGSNAAFFALRKYSFRAGATKIFLLLTNTERRSLSYNSNWFIARALEKYDITLNVFGKYKKFRSDLMGMDYQGRLYRRKVPKGYLQRGVELPEGDYMSLMRATRGSVFGLDFLTSENLSKKYALQQATVNVWKEQIERDQAICKECVCVSTRGGQGVTYCRNNPYHKC